TGQYLYGDGTAHRAMAAYDQGLSYTPNAPALWSDRGSLLRRLGRPQEAQKCFERAIRFDPLDLTARQLLADLHYAEERYRQAQSIYEEIVRLNPRAADAWSRIGICHLHQRRTQDAGDAFTMALRIDPEHAEAAEGQRIVSEMLERR
ncbi:MAG TPA: tetratricopeptide repeat protein, partial [Roseiflexaceae bacterium]|nr:tetratricopeptide repeat protein [Roseiflexaceae bacterium]